MPQADKPTPLCETKRVTFTIMLDELALRDRGMHFVVESGQLKVVIGSSSEDIRLTGEFSMLADVTYKELH